MKIYTRTGDQGQTSLLSGGRVAKDAARVEAYGTLDELNSVLGLLRSEPLPAAADGRLAEVQASLFTLGAVLADPDGRLQHDPAAWEAAPIESWIDSMEDDLEPLDRFILPGGSRPAALAHVARTVCRRAERRVLSLAGDRLPDGVLPFINRLSDALFVLARWLNVQAGVTERRWSPG